MNFNAAVPGRNHVAAFFDIDGTLLAPPSLERQFLALLRYRQAIPLRNYFLWLARAVRLAPRGLAEMRHANKMYLRGVSIHGFKGNGQRPGLTPRRGSGQAELAASRFFPDAVDQIAWHALQGHAIVLVSGTLAPLAAEVGLALTIRLAVRGVAATVAVCATRLEESDGRWTGRIVGEALFGEAKGRAVRRLARERGFSLERCYAYGDNLSDRPMLGAVRRAAVVNPSWRLARFARKKKWPVFTWTEGKNSGQSSPRTQSTRSKAEEIWEKVG
jgi:HAD superfamily hydrolase (TIGR01490 family)